jgi:glutathione synthase/RimK-type ligase-like ATP-grasp enzyme
MVVCIISNPDDAHAIAVERALVEKKIPVMNWVWGDYPGVDRLSFEISPHTNTKPPLIDVPSKDITLWVHRGMSAVPAPTLHPADIEFVRAESRQMLEGVFTEISREAFCVNPRIAIARIRSKMNELSLAKKCDLFVPHTLFSNNPEKIRSFFDQNDGQVVVKHTSQMHWESSEDKSVKMTYTSRISSQHLRNDFQISACPSIFQKEIKKDFELRIVFMGNTIFAIKLDSQKNKETLDWRLECDGSLPCSLFSMPKNELSKVKNFIKESGLMYGSIDMIVDVFGNYVFLEVNETGQFLWIEELLPDVPLLDCFSEFLSSQNPNFEYQRRNRVCRWEDLGKDITFEFLKTRNEGHATRTSSNKIIE